MKKKLIYEAPVTEQIQVRFEQNIMSVQNPTSPAKMDTHDSDYWGDWE